MPLLVAGRTNKPGAPFSPKVFSPKGLTADQISRIMSLHLQDAEEVVRMGSGKTLGTGFIQERLHADDAAAGFFEFGRFDQHPCQPFLSQNLRKALRDPRSGETSVH